MKYIFTVLIIFEKSIYRNLISLLERLKIRLRWNLHQKPIKIVQIVTEEMQDSSILFNVYL